MKKERLFTYTSIVAILYTISLFLPAFNDSTFLGIICLAFDWLGFSGENFSAGFAWLANITFFLTIMKTEKLKDFKFLLSIITLILGLFALNIDSLPTGENTSSVAVRISSGFFVWYFCFILIFIKYFLQYRQKIIYNYNQDE